MSRTTIEWCAVPGTIPESWNPVKGCSPIATGCANCYAARMTRRLEAMGQRAYAGLLNNTKGHFNGKVVCDFGALHHWRRWKRARTIFVCSMSDLFHEAVSSTFIREVLDVCRTHPQHTFILLTKRGARMQNLMGDYYGRLMQKPARNIWCMVSVSTQSDYDKASHDLRWTPAAVRGLSIEPLLSPITLGTTVESVDWVIVGAESKGAHAGRMCKNPWVCSIVLECREHNIPVFVKQLQFGNRLSKDPAEWPKALRVREYPRVGED